MTYLEIYNQKFMETFGVTEDELLTLKYQSVKMWDSVGHMQLIAELEDSFDIMFDTDDIIDFSSYKKGKELLRKYEIEV